MFNYEFPPLGGGAGNACDYLLREFSDYDDLEVDLITFSENNQFQLIELADNITVHKLKAGKKADYHYWKTFELLRWLIKSVLYGLKISDERNYAKYDLVHCWAGWPSGFIGFVLNIRRKLPYIVALRGSDIPSYNSRFFLRLLENLGLKFIYKRIWRRAEAVTVLSKDSEKMASKLIDLNYKLIRNGIDTSEFYPSAIETNYQKRLRLLYVGRLVKRKGIDLLLRAVDKLHREGYTDKFKLEIVGQGKMLEDLKQYVSENKLEEFVTFAGRIPHERLPEVYRRSDVFVLPSITEALGNVTQEAIASGLPIITTDTGAAELVTDNGIVIEIGDVNAIVESIRSVIDKPDQLKSMRASAIEKGKRMDWSTTAEQYFQLYQSKVFPGR
jgi:glycosyltransferase involved in cell wall biosynthesis